MWKSVLSKTPNGVRRLIYASPRLHGIARRISAASYRDDSWQWCRITGGAAEGLWIEAKPRTHKFCVAGTFEPAVERTLVSHAFRGAVWDVGAHIGYFVLVALRRGSPVVAIEPNPSNTERIRATLARNELDAVVLEVAAGASNGTAHLDVQSESSKGQISSTGMPITIMTLDALLENYPPPALVKIDVEGFEGDVLRGATRLLREIKPLLLVELHPWADQQLVFDRLVAYDITELDADHLLASPR